MPSTKPQKAAKAANTEDDTQRFVERQKGMYKAIKNRRDEARSRIRQNHSNRQKDLQARIKALKRSSSVKHHTLWRFGCFYLSDTSKVQAKTLKPTFRSRPGSNAEVPTLDHPAFEALRDLLAHKADIERRIAQSIDTLEKAMNTASNEFQVVLRSQAGIFKTATTPANTSAAAASSKALIVKQ
ncbi:hypothetical protein KCV06_g1570, partial [Aureobasidium melanogenum]